MDGGGEGGTGVQEGGFKMVSLCFVVFDDNGVFMG